MSVNDFPTRYRPHSVNIAFSIEELIPIGFL